MTTHTSQLAAQQLSLITADHSGQEWAGPDLDMLIETRELPAIEVALVTSRTLYAVYTKRRSIARAVTAGPRVRRGGLRVWGSAFIDDEAIPALSR